jgi:ribonuclease P protein component
MNRKHRERIDPVHRLRSGTDHARVKASSVPLRGRFCLLLVLACPGEPTRVGFIASRKAVGGAVQRNRARRRMREIVRRRWPRMQREGYWITFIAFRSVLAARHEDLATDIERLLAQAGALDPIETETLEP